MRKRPLIITDFSNGDPRGRGYKDNIRQQNLLLKGFLLTSNLVEAGQYAGIKRKVDLYRTFDRLSVRKDYQEALMEEGITPSFLAKSLKFKVENEDKDATQLEALKVLLRSMGLDKYEKEEEESKGWEQAVTDYMDNQNLLPTAPKKTVYEVKRPEIPESARKAREEDSVLGKELYDK